MAQEIGALAFEPDIDRFFISDLGDRYTSMLLNQILGPLFPAPGRTLSATIFSRIVGALNLFLLSIGTVLLFYNIIAGTLQTAHEGVVLGRRWSSLWAPLRVLFAVALLIPVPGLGGYNAVQTGIAWLVRGSTLMASEIWSYGAGQILKGDIPVTGTGRPFDAEIFKTVYRNQLCRQIADYQFSIADSPLRIEFKPIRIDGTVEYISMIANKRDGVCGTYGLPKSPRQILLTHGATTPTLTEEFQRMHSEVLTGLIQDADRIITLQWPIVISNSGPLPDVTDVVGNAIQRANLRLESGNNFILETIAGSDGEQQTARNILEQHIIGQNCGNAGTNSFCMGEGWIGAGSWYMTIARLNSELMGLLNASITATESTHLGDETNRLNRIVASDADGVGWLRRAFRPVDANKYLHLSESSRIWNMLTTDLEQTTARLAPDGFVIPSKILDQAAPDTSSGILARIWRANFAGGVETIIANLSPSTWGDDPIVGMVNMGNWYLDTASLLIFGGMAITLLSGSISTTITFLIAAPLAAIGIAQSFILPMLPFLYWILSVAGYFILVIEAVIGGSLWALAHLRLDGEGISGDAGKQGWVYLLALMLTPPLMVIGYFVGMILFRIVTSLLDTGMYYAMSALVNSSPFVGICGLLATGIILVISYAVIIERSFSLVSELPDRVLKWIGTQAQITSDGATQIQTRSLSVISNMKGGIHKLAGPIAGSANAIRGGARKVSSFSGGQ